MEDAMDVSLTIKNADKYLIDAIKSVIKLSPKASVQMEQENTVESSLLSDHAEIQNQIANGTLKTYNSMEEYKIAHAI